MGAKGGDYRPHPYLSAKSHPPLWQVLLASQAQSGRRPHLRPKGIDPRTAGFWLNHAVRGVQEGAPLGQYLRAKAKKGVPPSAGCQASTRPSASDAGGGQLRDVQRVVTPAHPGPRARSRDQLKPEPRSHRPVSIEAGRGISFSCRGSPT
jgi:hypothetical protein